MRADLLHAQASIDWAVSQFPTFSERIEAWLKENIKTGLRDPDPNVPNNVLVAFEKEPLPLSFVVEVGAYVNAIRSGLDILAVSLANRYGIPKPQDAYFPVVPSEAEFLAGKYNLARGCAACASAEIFWLFV